MSEQYLINNQDEDQQIELFLEKAEVKTVAYPVIEVSHVTYAYKHNLVLDDVNLSVMPGEFVSLMGANGSGKSTLLKIILGELTPLKGDVKIMGKPVSEFSEWSKIGYVAQNKAASYSGFPATVEEVVTAHLYEKIGRFRMPGRRLRQRVIHALELVDMAEYIKRPIGELSGGQQQRVLLARAMVNDPLLVILDEPTTGVDAQNAKAHFELLRRLNQEIGLTVFVVTHDMTRSAEYIKKSYCIDYGSMVCLEQEQIKYELSHKHKHPDKHGDSHQ